MLSALLSSFDAVFSTDGGASADVWVTRVTLLLAPVTASIIAIVQVVRGNASTAAHLSAVDEKVEEHHKANTRRLDAIESKIDDAAAIVVQAATDPSKRP